MSIRSVHISVWSNLWTTLNYWSKGVSKSRTYSNRIHTVHASMSTLILSKLNIDVNIKLKLLKWTESTARNGHRCSSVDWRVLTFNHFNTLTALTQHNSIIFRFCYRKFGRILEDLWNATESISSMVWPISSAIRWQSRWY